MDHRHPDQRTLSALHPRQRRRGRAGAVLAARLELELGAGRVPRRRGRLGVTRRVHRGRVHLAGSRDIRQLGRLLLQPGVRGPGVRRAVTRRQPRSDRRVVLRQEPGRAAVRPRSPRRVARAQRGHRRGIRADPRRRSPARLRHRVHHAGARVGRQPPGPGRRCRTQSSSRTGGRRTCGCGRPGTCTRSSRSLPRPGPGIVGGIAAAFGRPELAVEAFARSETSRAPATARRMWALSRVARAPPAVAVDARRRPRHRARAPAHSSDAGSR